jgi:tetratricopeptide (TPR) repeat protein
LTIGIVDRWGRAMGPGDPVPAVATPGDAKHTRQVRPVVIGLVVVLGAAPAAAEDRYADAPARPDDFWQELIEPHGEEVQQVLGKINEALLQASQHVQNDSDPDGRWRARMLDDARGMARYLRRLSPQNPAVLYTLGRVADEAGRADEAIEALTAYLAIEPDGQDAQLRLGRIHLRRREYPDAIRYLRAAAAMSWTTEAAVYLANALTAVGRDEEALAVLKSSGERTAMFGSDYQIGSFALAVAYDRDEQLSEAFDVLDRMQSVMQSSFTAQMQMSIDSLHLVPAVEVHYFRALLYESSGFLDEARASWLIYAAGGDDARFRRRALAHVAAIDLLRARELAARKAGRRAVPEVVP